MQAGVPIKDGSLTTIEVNRRRDEELGINVVGGNETPMVSNNLGGTQYKRPYATNMGSKISLLVYEWPLIECKICYMNGVNFSKFAQILSQNWLKFKKILESENQVILLKIWPKIGPIGM